MSFSAGTIFVVAEHEWFISSPQFWVARLCCLAFVVSRVCVTGKDLIRVCLFARGLSRGFGSYVPFL